MSFDLPPHVSFKKEKHTEGWAYVFRHAQLGKLGRILLKELPDGRTNFVCELVEDCDDPLAEKRAAIFKPLGLSLASAFDRATGGTGASGSLLDDPPRFSGPKRMIKSKMVQCTQCDVGVALLIFADHATDLGGLEDYARLMHRDVVRHDLPTWVIGPPCGPAMDDPSDILNRNAKQCAC